MKLAGNIVQSMEKAMVQVCYLGLIALYEFTTLFIVGDNIKFFQRQNNICSSYNNLLFITFNWLVPCLPYILY